jgi:hypothetical protein
LLAALVALGCTDRSRPPPYTFADSSSVRIVESKAASFVPGTWQVEEEAVVDLTHSGVGPRHEFFRVADGEITPDGSIILALQTEMRFFSPVGRLLGHVGRAGDGPGEFRRISDVGILGGDSVLVFDAGLQRTTIIGPEMASFRVAALATPDPARLVEPIDESSLLAVLVPPSPILGGEPGLVRTPEMLVRLDMLGRVVDTIARLPGSDVVRIASAGGYDLARPLFGRRSHAAVRNRTIYLGTADALEYSTLSIDGVPGTIARVPGYDLSLASEALDAERAARLEMNPSERTRRLLAQLPEPDFRPAYDRLLVSEDGAVWLAEHMGEFRNRLLMEPHRWLVFDSIGIWIAVATVPRRFRVLDVAANYVLGVYSDADDVEHVQVRAIVRTVKD